MLRTPLLTTSHRTGSTIITTNDVPRASRVSFVFRAGHTLQVLLLDVVNDDDGHLEVFFKLKGVSHGLRLITVVSFFDGLGVFFSYKCLCVIVANARVVGPIHDLLKKLFVLLPRHPVGLNQY